MIQKIIISSLLILVIAKYEDMTADNFRDIIIKPIYCSNISLLDDNFEKSSDTNNCFKNCKRFVESCYFISGVTYCYPQLRNSNKFVENSTSFYTTEVGREMTPIKIGNETNYIVTYKNISIFHPGQSSKEGEISIFFNGQWLSSSQWVKIPVALCKINYKHKLFLPKKHFFSERKHRKSIISKVYTKRSVINQLYVKDDLFLNYEREVNKIINYNRVNLIKRNLDSIDQCEVPQTILNITSNVQLAVYRIGAPAACYGQKFTVSSVNSPYNDLLTVEVLINDVAGPNVKPIGAFVTDITTGGLVCWSSIFINLSGAGPTRVRFSFDLCPLTVSHSYLIAFTCFASSYCATQVVELIHSDNYTYVDSYSGFNFTMTNFTTVLNQNDITCLTSTNLSASDGILDGFSLVIGKCTVAPTNSPTTKSPTFAPTTSPTKSPTKSPTSPIAAPTIIPDEDDLNLETIDVYANWNQPVMSVISSVNELLDIWFTKPGINSLFVCNGSCVLTVPDNFYIDSVSFVMFIYNNASLVYQNDYPVNPYVSCPIPTNPISPVWAQSWYCFGPLGQFVLVSACIGIAAILVASLILLVLLCYITIFCIQNRNSATVINNITMATENAKESSYNAIEAVPKWAKELLNKSTSSRMDTLLIICLFFPLIVGATSYSMCNSTGTPGVMLQNCQYSFSLSSQDIVCTSGVCEVNFNYQTTFALLGQTICLNFMSPSGNIITTLQLTYQFHMRSVQLRYKYTTYSWTAFSSSYKGCPVTSTCPFGSCPPAPSVPNPNAANDLFNNLAIATFPSFLNTSFINSHQYMPNLQCSGSCGCAGCGCFFCTDGCLWSYYELIPVGTEFYVFEPLTQYSYPILNGMFYRPGAGCYDSIVDINFKTSSMATIDITSIFSQNNIVISSSVSTTGSSSPYLVNFVLLSDVIVSEVNFGTNSIICNMVNNDCFLGFAAPPNGPVAGVPGDIQYASESLLNQVWNPTSILQTLLQSSVTFAFPPKGARFVDGTGTNPYPKFPLRFGSTNYVVSYFNLVGLDATPGPLTIGINTLNSFRVAYTDSTICPEISLNTAAAGCSSCLLGATIIINGISTCSSGFAFLSLVGPGDIGTSSSFFNTTTSTMIIQFFPNNESATFILTASYKNHNSSFSFSGFFPRMAQIDNGTWITQNNVSTIISSNEIGSWWDNQSLTFKIGISFSIGIGIFLIIAAIGCLVAFFLFRRPPSVPYASL